MKKRLGRVPLLVLGIISLVCGVWGGLIRLPLNLALPTDHANWISFHGPLMVCGFLGTVIGLERAVGLPGRWTYAAPILTGLGAVLVAGGALGLPGPVLLTLGSGVFVAVTWRVVQLQRALFTVTMSLGAMAWFVGNVLWVLEWPVNRVVPWWMAFLGLTIVGERLDLSRFQKPERAAQPLLFAAIGLFVGGVVLSALRQTAGEVTAGAGLFALAAWLGRFDIARRTVRQPGLPRFMAACLLSGYLWLGATGVMMMLFAPMQAGMRYDAVLHSFFLGFVFLMIFGHAPVIFPSVLMLPVAFRTRFYVHVLLLHASLALRVVGDLTEWTFGRQAGGALNGVTIAVFLANTVLSLIAAGKTQQTRSKKGRVAGNVGAAK